MTLWQLSRARQSGERYRSWLTQCSLARSKVALQTSGRSRSATRVMPVFFAIRATTRCFHLTDGIPSGHPSGPPPLVCHGSAKSVLNARSGPDARSAFVPRRSGITYRNRDRDRSKSCDAHSHKVRISKEPRESQTRPHACRRVCQQAPTLSVCIARERTSHSTAINRCQRDGTHGIPGRKRGKSVNRWARGMDG